MKGCFDLGDLSASERPMARLKSFWAISFSPARPAFEAAKAICSATKDSKPSRSSNVQADCTAARAKFVSSRERAWLEIESQQRAEVRGVGACLAVSWAP
jgi:hypothetical protein